MELTENVILEEYKYQNSTLNDVVKIETSPNIEEGLDLIFVQEFFFSKSVGFLEISLNNGEKWVLL